MLCKFNVKQSIKASNIVIIFNNSAILIYVAHLLLHDISTVPVLVFYLCSLNDTTYLCKLHISTFAKSAGQLATTAFMLTKD